MVTLGMPRPVMGSSTCCCHLNFLQLGGFISRLCSQLCHVSLLTPFLFIPVSIAVVCIAELLWAAAALHGASVQGLSPLLVYLGTKEFIPLPPECTMPNPVSVRRVLENKLSGPASAGRVVRFGSEASCWKTVAGWITLSSALSLEREITDWFYVTDHMACLSILCIPRFLLFIQPHWLPGRSEVLKREYPKEIRQRLCYLRFTAEQDMKLKEHLSPHAGAKASPWRAVHYWASDKQQPWS